MRYLQEHGSFIRREVGSQNIPEPDDDSVTAVKASIVHSVLPESNPMGGGAQCALTLMGTGSTSSHVTASSSGC